MAGESTDRTLLTRISPARGVADLPRAEPEEVGMSSERLARIRPAMQRYVDRNMVPGVVTLIARHGRVVYLDAIGFRDAEARAPMMTDTIFRVASMTKAITSVALMTLYEEGHFLLSDPVSKWIPEFADPKVAIPIPAGEYVTGPYKLIPAARPIAVRAHTHSYGRPIWRVYRFGQGRNGQSLGTSASR